MGFTASVSDTSLFVLRESDDLTCLLLYVNAIILMASSALLLRRITERTLAEFAMTDLGNLHHILGIAVTRYDVLFLSQRQ